MKVLSLFPDEVQMEEVQYYTDWYPVRLNQDGIEILNNQEYIFEGIPGGAWGILLKQCSGGTPSHIQGIMCARHGVPACTLAF